MPLESTIAGTGSPRRQGGEPSRRRGPARRAAGDACEDGRVRDAQRQGDRSTARLHWGDSADAFAVFLPQVAPEQGWDLETTLTHLSLKAGLSADAWREGAKFETFQAEVFHE